MKSQSPFNRVMFSNVIDMKKMISAKKLMSQSPFNRVMFSNLVTEAQLNAIPLTVAIPF